MRFWPPKVSIECKFLKNLQSNYAITIRSLWTTAYYRTSGLTDASYSHKFGISIGSWRKALLSKTWFTPFWPPHIEIEDFSQFQPIKVQILFSTTQIEVRFLDFDGLLQLISFQTQKYLTLFNQPQKVKVCLLNKPHMSNYLLGN